MSGTGLDMADADHVEHLLVGIGEHLIRLTTATQHGTNAGSSVGGGGGGATADEASAAGLGPSSSSKHRAGMDTDRGLGSSGSGGGGGDGSGSDGRGGAIRPLLFLWATGWAPQQRIAPSVANRVTIVDFSPTPKGWVLNSLRSARATLMNTKVDTSRIPQGGVLQALHEARMKRYGGFFFKQRAMDGLRGAVGGAMD